MTIQSNAPTAPAQATTNLPVFVYGTLRTGQGNYAWALAGKTVTEQRATLTNALMFDNGGFPFVIDYDPNDCDLADGEYTVTGDLMEIDPEAYPFVMNALDRLEGYYGEGKPMNMYDRHIVTVTTEDGQSIEAYTYFAARASMDRVSRLPLIPSGDWLNR